VATRSIDLHPAGTHNSAIIRRPFRQASRAVSRVRERRAHRGRRRHRDEFPH
jgi:hypothetical protein